MPFKSLKTLTLAVVAAGSLVACTSTPNVSAELATQQANYNKGEAVILSLIGKGACLNCFNIYRNMDGEKAFAISDSGIFGYTNSKSTAREARQGALDSCKARNTANESSQPCRLLMDGDRYVWRGRV